MVPSSLAFLDTRTFLLYTRQTCAVTLFFPSQLCFPRTQSRRTCGSILQRDKTHLSSLKGSRDVYFDSLAQIPGWSQETTYITWGSSLFSEITEWLQCTWNLCCASGLSEPAGLHSSRRLRHPDRVHSVTASLSPPSEPSSCTPQATGFCSTSPLMHTSRLGRARYIDIQKLPSPHFTAWKQNVLFLKEQPLIADA